MHCLIIGRTLSGKTTFGKKKAKALKRQGKLVFVLDPFLDPEWEADFITDDKDEFLQVVWANKNAAVFVDEGGSTVGKYSEVMNELATRGRHWGHKVYFISQRAKQISTTIRTQCSELVIFKQSQNDSKDLSDEFVEPIILQADKLAKGEFYYVRDNQPTVKLNVFQL